MKKLFAVVALLCAVSSFAGIPYLVTPTNQPGSSGQVLVTAGDGTSYWGSPSNLTATATNVVLGPGGQIDKAAGSSSAVIHAGGIGSTNLALQSVDKTNIVNNTITSNQLAVAGIHFVDLDPAIGVFWSNNVTALSNNIQTAANAWTGVNEFRVLQRFDSVTITNGLTNASLTASTALVSDANKKIVSLSNGGANTFLQGTTPPSYTSIPDGALSANVALQNTANSFIGANSFAGVNTFKVLQRMDSLVVTNGLTNSALTANSAVISDANKAVTSLANGGNNTFLQGTTPPSYTSIPDAALSANVALENAVNTFGVLQRMDSLVVTNGFTNSSLTASTALVSDANKKVVSLANGGNNVLLHGTTPPAYSAVVEADQTLSDVTTANASTSAHGYLKKLDNNAAHYMDGTGNWSTPSGGGGSAFPLTQDANFNNFGGTNISYLGGTNGINIQFGGGPTSSAMSLTNANGTILNIDTNGNAVFLGGVKAAGFTNTSLSANTMLYADANKAETSLANGGANTFLQGTSPPSYTSIPDAALSANVPLLNAANAWSGVNQFKVLTRADSLVVTNGFTNSSLTASTALLSDANKKVVSLANGGNNTFLQGTTPPSYTSIPDAALSANIPLLNAANAWTAENQFRVIQHFDALVVTNGLTNSSLTASSAVLSDANKKIVSLANGGANTFLQGTTPPSYTSIPDAALSVNVMFANAANAVTGVNQFRVLQRMDSLVVTNGFTNSSLTASTVASTDANKQLVSIANGGNNTLLHGTTPPQYLAVSEGDFSFSDVLTANASTSAHGLLKKLDNNSAHFLDGTGNWSAPAGAGAIGSTNTSAYINDSGSWGWYWTNNLQELMDITKSQVTVKTNWQFDGNGGATMQRVSYGSTNGFLSTYNIIDFGANPAAANNTTAIQNALNAASTNGGTVFVPPATNAYTFTGTLTIPKNVTLLGSGTPHTGTGSYLYNSTASTLIVLQDGGVIRGVQINGGGVGNNQYGIVTSGDPNNPTTTYRIENNLLKNLGWGIYLSNSWNGQVLGNDISSCNSGVTITNYGNAIDIMGGHIGACIKDIDIRGDAAPQINNINIRLPLESSSNAVSLVGANWANINLSGSYFEGSTNAIYAGAGQNLNLDHVAFMQTAGTATTNIVLRGTKGVSMDHDYFFNSVAFDADSATFGLSFEKNKLESAVTWNNRATTYSMADNTNTWTSGIATNAGWVNTAASANTLPIFDGNKSAVTLANGTQGYPLVSGSSTSLAPYYTNTVPYANTSTNADFVLADPLTNHVYVTNLVQNILTPATATNTMPLYGGFWRLVVSGPAAITNLTGVTAGTYTWASCTFSNSLATTITNRMLINAIAMGYDATNSVASLGLNGFVVGAGKQVRLLVDAEGINQTNWMIIRQ